MAARKVSTSKPNPFAKMMMAKAEKKEGKKEPKESMKMMGKEKMMGIEKYKSGGKVGKKKC